MSDLRKVEELTLKLLDGDIDDKEQQQLEQLVSRDAQALTLHLQLLQQEAILRGERAEPDLTGPTMERLRRMQAERLSAGVMERIHAHLSSESGPLSAAAEKASPGRRVLFRGLIAAAAAAALAVAVVAGYFAHKWSGKSDISQTRTGNAAQNHKVTLERIDKVEAALRTVRRELKKLAALEDRVLRQAKQSCALSEADIARARSDLDALVKRQDRVVRLLKSGAGPARAHVGQARAVLEKLDELQGRLYRLAAETSKAGKDSVGKMLGEIEKRTRVLRAVIQLASAVRRRTAPRPRARRMYHMPGRGPAKARRAMMAADAFGDH